jgi:hypothetical protein
METMNPIPLMDTMELLDATERTPACESPGRMDGRDIVAGALGILDQGEALLAALSNAAYTQKIPLVFNASIGAHYRHCLDHFQSLIRGLDSAEIDYDHRDRDSSIETRREFALEVTRALRQGIHSLSPEMIDMPVVARSQVDEGSPRSPATGSTLGRELVYGIAHAIHHFALVSVMGRLMGVAMPRGLGLAPSTAAHLARANPS